ncbi:MAG: hypothetical protein AAF493_06435, partial [Pseudomonadota bacterium]
ALHSARTLLPLEKCQLHGRAQIMQKRCLCPARAALCCVREQRARNRAAGCFGKSLPAAGETPAPQSLQPSLSATAGSTDGDQLTTSPNREGYILMNLDDDQAKLPETSEEDGEDREQVSFVEDEELGSKVSVKLASYTEQCCSKRIDKEQLSIMKRRCPRPENCPTLIVPQ